MGVHGINGHVPGQRGLVILKSYNGHVQMDARVTNRRVQMLPSMVIWKSYNGYVPMGVRWISGRVPGQLEVVI